MTTDKKDASLALPKYNIKKAAEVGSPRSILIFGPPKRGKSTCAASIVDVPGYERVLLIDVEGGGAAVSQWYPEVDVLEVPTAKMFAEVVTDLVNGKIVEPVSGEPYQAVIIDTLDKAQERQLEVYDNSPESRTKEGGKNELYKWGAIKQWTTKLADALHMADFLTIFVAHIMEDKNEKTGKVTTTVMLGGASKYNFPSTSDLVGIFDVTTVKNEEGKNETKRMLDFTVSPKTVAGQRYAGKLNGKILEPDMKTIYQKIDPERFKTVKTDKD